MKPRRPSVKDSTQTKSREAIARKAAQVAARAKRKAAAKKLKLEAEKAAAGTAHELWIGLVELRPLKKGHENPAFTNILTWASDPESFRAKADIIAANLNMYVIGVEGEEPLAARWERSELTEEVEDMYSRASSNPNAIVYGTFHGFPDHSN